ncbi:immunity protein YezG family protein [Dyella sp. 2HG41-7]|uniref:immunity protein YezG family protein n=1 Tax=Dyella sp. 2HG41-7 TaxID=2883239 RepID=UPI001F3C7C97|nr:immunity protein YezG family protein [Dyella sp. 2HG41-7]
MINEVERMDQFQIIQEIAIRAISGAQPDWSELIILYHVEGGRSSFVNSYLVSQDGVVREKPARVSDDLDTWLRRLRAELARGGKQPFTSCKLHLCADGKFDASYGYEPVNWGELLIPSWNFPLVTSLH